MQHRALKLKQSDSKVCIKSHFCLLFSLPFKHTDLTFTGATVLLMGFVVGCTNNNLRVSKTTSAVHGQPNAFIQWVFGSFVSRVWDTLGCGCPWESCHCPVLWDYTHVRTHSDRWAASSAAEHQNSVKPQNHTALFLWDVSFFAHSSSFCEFFQTEQFRFFTKCQRQPVSSAWFSHSVCGACERASNCITHWPCSRLHLNKDSSVHTRLRKIGHFENQRLHIDSSQSRRIKKLFLHRI